MDVLFGKAPKMHRDSAHPAPPKWPETDTDALDLREVGLRVLAHPAVASKSFLITIGDRTVGGLTARDQMVGPVSYTHLDVYKRQFPRLYRT